MSASGDSASRICLGTVQLGMEYGVANHLGRPTDAECQSILAYAVDRGVKVWDTAPVYGDAEARLGSFLRDYARRDEIKIITKLPAPPEGVSRQEVSKWVKQQVETSLDRLCVDRVFGCLLHDIQLSDRFGSVVWETLTELKEDDRIQHFGVSVYDVAELERGMNAADLGAVQFPCNILDQRILRSRSLDQLSGQGTLCFARSPLLQGALTFSASDLPRRIRGLRDYLSQLQHTLIQHRVDVLQAALPFVISDARVNYVVIGVESRQQLAQNIELLSQPLSDELLESLRSQFMDVPAELLEPRRWPNDNSREK